MPHRPRSPTNTAFATVRHYKVHIFIGLAILFIVGRLLYSFSFVFEAVAQKLELLRPVVAEALKGVKMDPIIVGAIITAGGTIAGAVVGAILGRKRGKEEGRTQGTAEGFKDGKTAGYAEGLAEGRKHSLIKFMDEQETLLNRAVDALNRKDYPALEAIATALVDTAKMWRRIQENFRALLNGRIDDVAGILTQGNPQNLENAIRALHEGYKARRLAVETELEKSRI